MSRIFCLGLAIVLTSASPSYAQLIEPPKKFTNSIGMTFTWIHSGSFMMGSPVEERLGPNGIGFYEGEVQHKVTLTKGFYVGVHLVSQEQWEEVMGNNPSIFKGNKDLPVETVSWNDCQMFIKKLRERDKKRYRLPTEAEWEFCCRAGTTTPFYFGKTISSNQANYDGDDVYGDGKRGVNRKKTTPIGTFPANAWGLDDMHGNLSQWCQDWYGDYPKEAVTDPQGPEKGVWRVIRGGSWISGPLECRSALRLRDDPSNRENNCGLRVCFDVDEP